VRKRLAVSFGAGLVLISGVLVFGLNLRAVRSSSPATPNPQATPTPQEGAPFNQEEALANLRKVIAGQETKPAEEVFKNIQILKGMPAGRMLRVMELGYARSLGVNCTHCHVENAWEKEDKPTKQIAREMMKMTSTINSDLLKPIKNLKSESPIVNCTTCHRGQIKPELNLPNKS
jgi:hypothetical protein